MVVIMVKHDHIKQNWDKLKGKVVLDCHNICPLEGVYHIQIYLDSFSPAQVELILAVQYCLAKQEKGYFCY